MTSKEYLFRKVKDVPKTLEDMMNDPDATLKDEESAGFGGNSLPSISVGSDNNPKDIIAVEFMTEPEKSESKKKPGKWYAWADVKVLHQHQGYNSSDEEEVELNKGDSARMNLMRHKNLESWWEKNKPLKGRSFIIGTMGKVTTNKGNKAFDYRIKEITGQNF